MFSHASVILFTISLMDTQSLLILVGYSVIPHPCYSVVGTYNTGNNWWLTEIAYWLKAGLLLNSLGMMSHANCKICEVKFNKVRFNIE